MGFLANEVIRLALDGQSKPPPETVTGSCVTCELPSPTGWAKYRDVAALRALLGDMYGCKAEIMGFSAQPLTVHFRVRNVGESITRRERSALNDLKRRFGLPNIQRRPWREVVPQPTPTS